MEWVKHEGSDVWRASAGRAKVAVIDEGTPRWTWGVGIPFSEGEATGREAAQKAAIQHLRQMARDILAATEQESGEEPTMTAEDLLAAMGGGFSVPMPPPVWPAGGFGLDGKC